ncbi:MAG: hypothetical protein M1830_006030 [Pleopsidium flavum]|nr:MAG: hypothetical protein M1830_006030 [Pleopsidium flavum]
MVHKILFWSGFGISTPPYVLSHPLLIVSSHPTGLAVRFWQLGIEMRPFFNKESFWAYPVFAAAGGSFGYWLTGVENRQMKILADRRNRLLEKRKRRAEREGTVESEKVEEGGILASTS